jgi:hypothetical protein
MLLQLKLRNDRPLDLIALRFETRHFVAYRPTAAARVSSPSCFSTFAPPNSERTTFLQRLRIAV